MNKMTPKVDGFLRKAKKWREELAELRRICLECDLTEEVKWMHPCYTLDGRNIVLIHGFKEYCAIMYMKGALLKDDRKLLVKIGSVQSARQIRFTNVREIVDVEAVLKAYIHEAIAVEKAGLKVKLKTTAQFKMPTEFKKKLDEMPGLKPAFRALTPGRQRGYIIYFSRAKQAKTRAARVEKCLKQILEGKGLED